MGVELMVLVICKPPRPNLRVYLGFSVCPLGFVVFKTFTDVKWRKGTEKKIFLQSNKI